MDSIDAVRLIQVGKTGRFNRVQRAYFNTLEYLPLVLVNFLLFGKIFPKFITDPGLGTGLVSIAFDPAYSKNGKFYTVHVEKPDMSGLAAPSSRQCSS